MCIDKPERTQHGKPATTQQPSQIKNLDIVELEHLKMLNPKKEKQTKEVSVDPKIKSEPNKIITAPHQDRTPITKRVVESIIVII